MFDEYSIWTLVIILGVSTYLWNERAQVRKEISKIDELASHDQQTVKLLRLLIQLTGAVFVCLTFIFALVAIGLYHAGLFK